jgi:hypothetical protein
MCVVYLFVVVVVVVVVVAVVVVVVVVVVVPSPLAGEDGLRSKHGEGSPFLKTTTNRKTTTAFKYPVGRSPPPLFNQKWNYNDKEEKGIEGFCASALLHAE